MALLPLREQKRARGLHEGEQQQLLELLNGPSKKSKLDESNDAMRFEQDISCRTCFRKTTLFGMSHCYINVIFFNVVLDG
jgi:hypothetical protein